ncbi:GDP-L-fucose synthase family protein [Gillisia sp. Hel_I_29]|uniref:GDP-L-fucose synthase family protein n=1 Tax=Gillisia sp. Hel_I_29 TaxID=1249975 RepID=UPI0005526D33|nr:GDP-L-fucose synthase [Gillisia sp. Hel_I_29]
MKKDSKIYVAGHTGLVGSAFTQVLKKHGYTNLLLRTHKDLDLIDCNKVAAFFSEEKPEYVFVGAAQVGGIVANNKYRADFIYNNLMIQNNIIHESYINKVKKLLFLGSTCIYPINSELPIKEESLLSGVLEYTNEPYAIAKIAGIKMCESYNLQYGTNFLTAMPTNLYGPNDNYDLEKSHVLPALLRKIHLGHALETKDWDVIRKDLNTHPMEGLDGDSPKQEILDILQKYGVTLIEGEDDHPKVKIEIWGSGKARREFLHSSEFAEACLFIMENIEFRDISSAYNTKEIRNTHINIGTGKEISIKDLAFLVKETVGFKGELYFNSNKPEGTLRKVIDCQKLKNLGWQYSIEIEEGIREIYQQYQENITQSVHL